MPESIIDNDRDEARSARLAALEANEPHPPDCTCSRQCAKETSGLTEAQIRGWDRS